MNEIETHTENVGKLLHKMEQAYINALETPFEYRPKGIKEGLCYASITLNEWSSVVEETVDRMVENEYRKKYNTNMLGGYWFPIGQLEPRIELLKLALKRYNSDKEYVTEIVTREFNRWKRNNAIFDYK